MRRSFCAERGATGMPKVYVTYHRPPIWMEIQVLVG
jgi:hypothetical protein